MIILKDWAESHSAIFICDFSPWDYSTSVGNSKPPLKSCQPLIHDASLDSWQVQKGLIPYTNCCLSLFNGIIMNICLQRLWLHDGFLWYCLNIILKLPQDSNMALQLQLTACDITHFITIKPLLYHIHHIDECLGTFCLAGRKKFFF